MIDVLLNSSSESFEAAGIGYLLNTNWRIYNQFRSAEYMPLPRAERNDAALRITKRLLPSFAADDIILSYMLDGALLWYYEGEVLHLMLKNMKGMLIDTHGYESSEVLDMAILRKLPLRDSVATRMIVERTRNLHHCSDPKNCWYAFQFTPTSLAMYEPAMFLAWRNILLDHALDLEEFVKHEMEQSVPREEGWTEQTLTALFKYDFDPYKSPSESGFLVCERCGKYEGFARTKVDLAWRRLLRDFRCGRVELTKDDANRTMRDASLVVRSYNIVCSDKCDDGVCVALGYENDGTEEPDLPPYDPKWREKAKSRIEEVGIEDEDHGSRKIPGAFVE